MSVLVTAATGHLVQHVIRERLQQGAARRGSQTSGPIQLHGRGRSWGCGRAMSLNPMDAAAMPAC